MKLTEPVLKNAIAEFLKIPLAKLVDDAVLTELVRESFLLVEMVMFLQDEYSVRIIQEDLKTVRTVKNLVDVFISKSK